MKKVHIIGFPCLFVSLFTTATESGKTVPTFVSIDTLPEMKTVILNASDTVSSNDTTVFISQEVDASFPGGDNRWIEFVQRNLRANVPVKKRAPAGSYLVVVKFKIDKEGKLSVVEPVTSHGYGMEEELIRVLKKSPDWHPAMQNGKPINAYRKQPITFFVEKR